MQKAQPYGYAIIDTTGKDEPYVISAMRSRSSYERQQLTPASIERTEQHDRGVAEDWAYTWNLVERGYCGACKRLLAEIPGDHKGYTAVGYNRLYRVPCACSQED